MAGLTPEKIAYIAIHCSATQPKSDIGAKEIDRMHRQRGFLRIGYHYVIRRNGVVEKGREDNEIGAHVEGFNSVSLGVCMVGGIDANGNAEDNFTADQYAALGSLVAELHTKYPKAVIQGHRDFPNVHKDCPCFDVKRWWNDTVRNDGFSNPVDRAERPELLK